MTDSREKLAHRTADGYILGSADTELQRLRTISVLYRDITRRWLEVAGIGAGMSVVDAGCDPGDVALLGAGLVGPAETVIGVDSAPEALAMAWSRVGAAGLDTVRFEEADVASWVPDRPVDAVVRRLILMHLPDPAATLARLAGAVRPGGVVAFQDIALATRRTEPYLPLVGAFNYWVLETLRRAGHDRDEASPERPHRPRPSARRRPRTGHRLLPRRPGIRH